MKSIFIIGPSGSGKSTLSQYLKQIYASLFDQNSVLLINLDPANLSHSQSQEQNHYDIDVNDLVTVEDIMEEFEMGPNGAILYAMDFLHQNKSWLHNSIAQKIKQKQPHLKILETLSSDSNYKNKLDQTLTPFYIIFDLPGQIELYLQNDSTKNIVKYIQNTFTQNTCILQLFDSTYIYQANDFVSLCMMSLVTMINLEMPHINVLNKIDVIKEQRPALGLLNQYFDIYSMKAVIDDLTFGEQDQSKKILNTICEVLDQYNQVSFIPCSVYKVELIKYLILQIEKTFNTHQINKLNSPKYAQFISSVDKSFAKEEIITELENQLFRDEDEEEQKEKQQLEKVLSELKKDIEKKGNKKH